MGGGRARAGRWTVTTTTSGEATGARGGPVWGSATLGDACPLELQTNLCEDFTIVEKASTIGPSPGIKFFHI